MTTLVWIILATSAVSVLALVGIFALWLNERILKKIIFPLVAFSAGALMAGALLHLIPGALSETRNTTTVFLGVLAGFSVFFLLEQFIHWHHCHRPPSEHKHPVTYLILISDAVHNFLDGLAIGAAFIVDTGVGLVTTMAVAAHEIPQELGDFGILIHGGWEKTKALLFNFLSGLTTVAGGLLIWFLAGQVEVAYILPFAAGNFIYIAASDLIPEIKHKEGLVRNILHFLAFLTGILLMYAILFLEIG